MGPVLLDMDIDELSFPNYVDKVKFPNLEKIKVKICALNDPEARLVRMQEVRLLSETIECRRV